MRGGGGILILSNFKKKFTTKTRHFQVYLRKWSRGHQVLGHSCNLGKLPIFYHARKSKSLLFLLFSQVKRGWIETKLDKFNPSPSKQRLNYKETQPNSTTVINYTSTKKGIRRYLSFDGVLNLYSFDYHSLTPF